MNSFDFELPGKPDQVANFHTHDPRSHFCANGYRSRHSCTTPV